MDLGLAKCIAGDVSRTATGHEPFDGSSGAHIMARVLVRRAAATNAQDSGLVNALAAGPVTRAS